MLYLVRKIDESLLKTKPHLPHMGWNTVNPVKKDPVFDNVNKNNGFYFLHRYGSNSLRFKKEVVLVVL